MTIPGVFNVLDYGATPYDPYSVTPNSTDSYAAFRAAIDAMTAQQGTGIIMNAGAILYVPKGHYRLSQTLVIDKQLVMRGSSGAFTNPGSALWFDDGAWLHCKYTNGWGPGVGLCDGSVLEDFAVFSLGRTVPDTDGIRIRARVTLRNMTIDGFSRDGVNITAGLGYPLGHMDHGNASSWLIDNARIQRNGRHGVYVDSGDANAGSGRMIDATGNGVADKSVAWGIYDSSFLGNLWEACHVEANGGAFKADCVGTSLFNRCYSEAGDRPSEIAAPSIIVGGTHGADFNRAFAHRRFDDQCSPLLTRNFAGTLEVWSEVGGSGPGMLAAQYRAGDDAIAWNMHYDIATRRWQKRYGTQVLQTETTVRSPTAGQGARVAFPQGVHLGNEVIERRLTVGGSPPLSIFRGNLYTQGDRILHCYPVPGGFEGWVCTTTGGYGVYWAPTSGKSLGAVGEPVLANVNGFVYVCTTYTADPWTANKVYAIADVIQPSAGNKGYVLRCTKAGTSGGTEPVWNDPITNSSVPDGAISWQTDTGWTGATEPTWPTTVGATVIDGQIVWSCAGVTPPVYKTFGNIAL